MQYLDFEIEITSQGGRDYTVEVRSPAGEAREAMHFPFDEIALTNRLQTLEIAILRSSGQRREVLSPEAQTVQEFGRDLFAALFPGEARSRYDVSQQRAAEQDCGLRLKLRIHAPELAGVPWEFLYDPRIGEYVCLSNRTPLVRYLDLTQPIRPLRVSPPLRILGLVANPTNLPALDVVREKERVETALRDLQTAGQVEIAWLSGQTWRDLQRAMRGGPWHVFHFVGHGAFDPLAGEGVLALADDGGAMAPMSATALGRLLATHPTLRLVLLNSCEGARGDRRNLFSSTAARLVQRGIPAVLAMQYAISDHAAIEFARVFYEALVDGLPADAAVADARTAVTLALPQTVEWGTPVLFMRSPDGVLLQLDRAAPGGAARQRRAEDRAADWAASAEAQRWAHEAAAQAEAARLQDAQTAAQQQAEAAAQAAAQAQEERRQLNELLINSLDADHFQELAFLIGADYDQLHGRDWKAKARALIVTMERAGKTSQLKQLASATAARLAQEQAAAAEAARLAQERADAKRQAREQAGARRQAQERADAEHKTRQRAEAEPAAREEAEVALGAQEEAARDEVVRLVDKYTAKSSGDGAAQVPADEAAARPQDAHIISTATSARVVAVRTLTGHTLQVMSVAFVPDSTIFASGSFDNSVRLWRLADWATVRTLTGHTNSVRSVAVAPDGQLLASGADDSTVRLWRVADGGLVRTLVAPTGAVKCVAFAPDGLTLVGASGEQALLWRVADGALLRTLTLLGGAQQSVAFSPDGRMLASGGADNTARLWALADGALVRALSGHTAKVRCVAFSPDGKLLATGADDRTIRIWQVGNGQLVSTLMGHEGFIEGVLSVAFAPNGDVLASGGVDRTVRLWRVSDGQSLAILRGHGGFINGVYGVAFAPDGSSLVSAGCDTTLRVWAVGE